MSTMDNGKSFVYDACIQDSRIYKQFYLNVEAGIIMAALDQVVCYVPREEMGVQDF